MFDNIKILVTSVIKYNVMYNNNFEMIFNILNTFKNNFVKLQKINVLNIFHPIYSIQ